MLNCVHVRLDNTDAGDARRLSQSVLDLLDLPILYSVTLLYIYWRAFLADSLFLTENVFPPAVHKHYRIGACAEALPTEYR